MKMPAIIQPGHMSDFGHKTQRMAFENKDVFEESYGLYELKYSTWQITGRSVLNRRVIIGLQI